MKSNEWYTPSKYIEAAREVMGRIDLDPASCAEANLTVKATRYYDKTTNGLMQPWYGCVWLNPPFTGTTRRETWVQKLVREYAIGTIEQAVLLMPVAPDTAWFQPLWLFSICFPDERIYFYQAQPRKANPNFASCLIYFGPHESRFIDIFSRFGTVARRVSVPKPVPYMEELF